MRCVVEKVLYNNQENGYKIATLKTDNPEVPEAAQKVGDEQYPYAFTACGEGIPDTGAIEIEVEGKWVTHKKYGMQYKVEHVRELLPTTDAGIIAYLSSGLIKGIGEQTAKAIVRRFGDLTFDVFDRTPAMLLEIRGITEMKLETIMASYNAHKELRDIVSYLSPYGITTGKITKMYQYYGCRTMEVLKNSPFELCEIDGFGFLTVDDIAQKTGCALDDPLRIKVGLIYTLQQFEDQGHLFMLPDVLCAEADQLLNENQKSVSLKQVENALYDLIEAAELKFTDGAIYRPNVYHYEDATAGMVSGFLQYQYPKIDIEQMLPEIQRKLKIVLDTKQKEAVKMPFHSGISIITGGPGVGKTTILKVILALYSQVASKKILLMAPTGQASKRMAESTGFPASTIHKALGLMGDDDELEPEDKLDADLIVVDECSMVDMWLCYKLFSRIRQDTRVLLLGDIDQLPSVGPGNVLRELIHAQVPTIYLDVVYRQSADSHIHANAQKINRGKYNLEYGDDFKFLPSDSDKMAANKVLQEYKKYVKEYGIEAVQVLSPFKDRGKTSVAALNESIQAMVNPPKQGKAFLVIKGQTFRVGDKVINTKNREQLCNGDLGIIQKITGNGTDLKVSIQFSSGLTRPFTKDEMSSISLAYATTIHKSQGSEHRVVIVPLLRQHWIMLRRNLLYTAITRAKSNVVIVGQKSALLRAIKFNDIHKRNTMLGKRIVQYKEKSVQSANPFPMPIAAGAGQ